MHEIYRPSPVDLPSFTTLRRKPSRPPELREPGFDDKFDEAADSEYDCHGVKVVVDKKSALYLDGTTVDWYESLEKQGFTFENPNATKSCGCGSSFQA